ncbi:subtilisin-like protein [Lactarius quietus]|nr:subtilisin-like protein [Lactarius quietus]
MRLYLVSVLSVFAAAALAMPLSPPWQDRRVKHSWKTIPPNWESLGHPPPGTTIDLYIALIPRHEHALIDSLYDVSDPSSPNYGAHLSKEQVSQLVAPHPDTLELIHSWLRYKDIPSSSISTTHSGSCLKVTGLPVVQANELLGTSYQRYRRTGTNDTAILRTIGYALPTVLHEHVRTVIPTTYFASTHTLRPTPQRRSVEATANMTSTELLKTLSSRNIQLITPNDVRWLYRTIYYDPAATDQNVLGIAGFNGQYPSPADLTSFMKQYRTDAVSATFTVNQIEKNKYDPTNPGDEANLDIQWSQAIAYPTPHIFYGGGSTMYAVIGTNEPLRKGDMWADWLDYLLETPVVPQTISISYGDPEKHLPLEYVTTLCDMFAQLGALGVSVLCASGDDGVGKGNCKVKDGSVRFEPEWPSSCPYITSVGGTKEPWKRQYTRAEIAAELSGGGFSDHFAREPYQNDAVTAFLQQLGNQYDGLYNAAGRGIPDISAQALRFPTIRKGEGYYVSGTSCSAPTAAGVISLLNDYLLSIGRKPLGFLNPWLYGEGREALNDIKSGYNPGCGTDGFTAVAGWDPVRPARGASLLTRC